jgi:8-oxo-dGTP pyrophosphatase MutT (NUDIX family)
MDLDALRSGVLADLVDPAVVITSERVYAGRVWDVLSQTVEFAGGRMTREFLSHSGAVAVIAVDDDDNVLLINQYRQPIGTRDWEIPAGLLDVAGESALEAARRELAEETDLVAAEWSHLVSTHPSPGGLDEVVHIFEARGLTPAPDLHRRTDEEAEIVVRWVPLAEVVDAILDGRLHNGPLMIAVLAVAARRGARGRS